MKTKLLVAAVVLAGALTYLAVAGMKSGWVYYVEVDAFLADAQYHDQRVRLAGQVDLEKVATSAGRTSARFDLVGNTGRVSVAYQGAVPELFKPGCQVVVEGRLDAAGVFQADVMLTKCASKYQSEDHAKRVATPQGPSPGGPPVATEEQR